MVERRVVPPYGLADEGPARRSHHAETGTAGARDVKGKETFTLATRSRRHRTSGRGGYGSP